MLTLTNAKIFGPTGNVSEGALLLENKRIRQVGTDVRPPPGATTIDVGGRTVLPGMINAHSHLTFFKDGPRHPDSVVALKGAANAEQALLSGVTTIRDVGGLRHVDIALRQAIAEGWIPGPRVLASGRYIGMTGCHSFKYAREADGVDDVRQAVREQVKVGADQIKFMGSGGVSDPYDMPDQVQFTFDELCAGIDEAHRLGRRAAVHAHPATAIKNAVRAGADFVEHASFMDEEAVDLLARHKVVIVPTFAIYKAISESQQWPRRIRDKCAWVVDEKAKWFPKALAAGVKWGVGLDDCTYYPPDGMALELELLVAAGVSPKDALLGVTRENSRHLKLNDELGTIEEGKLADLVIFDGDPVTDVNRVRNPWLVIKEGKLHWPDRETRAVEPSRLSQIAQA